MLLFDWTGLLKFSKIFLIDGYGLDDRSNMDDLFLSVQDFVVCLLGGNDDRTGFAFQLDFFYLLLLLLLFDDQVFVSVDGIAGRGETGI